MTILAGLMVWGLLYLIPSVGGTLEDSWNYHPFAYLAHVSMLIFLFALLVGMCACRDGFERLSGWIARMGFISLPAMLMFLALTMVAINVQWFRFTFDIETLGQLLLIAVGMKLTILFGKWSIFFVDPELKVINHMRQWFGRQKYVIT